MKIRYKRYARGEWLLSAWVVARLRAFPEPPCHSMRCGGCGAVTLDTLHHPEECDRRPRRYRDDWDLEYDDLRADPKRMRLARRYFAVAVAELDNPAWWSG